jgi:hypothetical protein
MVKELQTPVPIEIRSRSFVASRSPARWFSRGKMYDSGLGLRSRRQCIALEYSFDHQPLWFLLRHFLRNAA